MKLALLSPKIERRKISHSWSWKESQQIILSIIYDEAVGEWATSRVCGLYKIYFGVCSVFMNCGFSWPSAFL